MVEHSTSRKASFVTYKYEDSICKSSCCCLFIFTFIFTSILHSFFFLFRITKFSVTGWYSTMKFLSSVIAILMANTIKSSAIHAQDNPVQECAELPPSEEFMNISKSLQDSASSITSRHEQQTFNFRVYAHVVYFQETSQGGYLSVSLSCFELYAFILT